MLRARTRPQTRVNSTPILVVREFSFFVRVVYQVRRQRLWIAKPEGAPTTPAERPLREKEFVLLTRRRSKRRKGASADLKDETANTLPLSFPRSMRGPATRSPRSAQISRRSGVLRRRIIVTAKRSSAPCSRLSLFRSRRARTHDRANYLGRRSTGHQIGRQPRALHAPAHVGASRQGDVTGGNY